MPDCETIEEKIEQLCDMVKHRNRKPVAPGMVRVGSAWASTEFHYGGRVFTLTIEESENG